MALGTWHSPLLLTQDQRLTQHLHNTGDLFSRVDRIISGYGQCKVTVGPMHASQPAAWTVEGQKVFINVDRLPYDIEGLMSQQALISIAGLNYHELGHVMYTPSADDPVLDHVNRSQEWNNAWNILEDQRMERKLVIKYPSIRHYLINTVIEQFFADKTEQQLGFAHILCHGRRYLPKVLRNRVKALCTHKRRKQLSDVIDEFRLLPASDTDRMVELTDRFLKLINEDPQAVENWKGDDQHQGMIAGPVKDQEDSEDTEDEDLDAEDKAEFEPQSDLDGDDQFDGDHDGDAADDADGSGSGAGNAIKDLIDDLKAHSQGKVKSDAEAKAKDIEGQAGGNGEFPNATMRDERVDPIMTLTAKRFGDALRNIVEDHDPGWLREQNAGKLNAGRYLLGRPLDEVFDKWEEGHNDAMSIETVVLADMSSSMQGLADLTSKALWSIKRGLDIEQNKTSVFGFNGGDALTIFQAHDRAEVDHYPSFYPSGGTEPSAAIQRAMSVFYNSRLSNQLFILLSDGDFFPGSVDVCDNMINIMNAAGVHTVSVFMAGGPEQCQKLLDPQSGWHDYAKKLRHNCQTFVPIHQPQQMIEVAKTVASKIMKGRGNGQA